MSLLRDGLHVAQEGAFLVLPAAQAGDPYTAALAIIGAADKAASVLQAAGADTVRQRFRDAVQPAELAKSVAGPISGATAILRADRVVSLLDDAARGGLRSVLDAGLDAVTRDPFVAADAVDLATMLDYRIAAARAKLATVLRQGAPGCSGTEALYVEGAVIGRTDVNSCTDIERRALFDTQLAKLNSSVGAASHPGLGEAEALLALARIATISAAADQISQLRQTLEALDRATVERRIGDVTPVSADLATTAALLGVTRRVPPIVVDHLTVVVRGNGEALQTRLEADGVALTIRARRALGDTPAPPDLVGSRGGQAELELRLAGLALTSVPGPETAGQLRSLIGQVDLSTPPGAQVALRAANLLGRSGCDLRPVIDLATGLLGRPRPNTGAEDVRRALAWRVLSVCGAAPSDAARLAVLGPAKAVLAAAKPGPSRPGLPEAARAAMIACALEPAGLDTIESWTAYGDDALAGGGVADPQGSYVDLEATFDLAVLTVSDHTSCSLTGQLG